MTVAVKTDRAQEGPVGRFVECPINGDVHPELVAIEVRRSWDKKQRERFWAFCPFCTTRIFLNRYNPELSARTIVWAESRGLHPVGITPARRVELLRELGLQQVNSPGQAWGPPPLPHFAPPPAPPRRASRPPTMRTAGPRIPPNQPPPAVPAEKRSDS